MSARRGERGLALVTVIVVLVALAIIATPFALSMRNLESASLLSFRREGSRAGTSLALAAAKRHLEETHPYLDVLSPHADSLAELAPDDLAERFPDLLPRDPKGAIRSVRIEDESGKVDLTRATPALLGNLLGGRTVLTADADADDDVFAVASGAGFGPAGLALVGREQVEYSAVSERAIGELRRGFASANLARSVAAAHAVGDELLDARLVLLVQRAWRVKPGVFEPLLRVEGLKQIALFSELAYDADTLERARPDLTVQGGPLRWRTPERVLGLEPRADGAVDVLLADGRGFGEGTLVRITSGEGEQHHDLVLAAVPWAEQWRVTLLEGVLGGAWVDDAVIEALAPVPVNLGSASPRVLEALLVGIGRQPVLDVVTEIEAVHLALLINEAPPGLDAGDWMRLAREPLEDGLFSAADLRAALDVLERAGLRPGEVKTAELAMAIAGSETRGPTLRLGRTDARELAGRIAAQRPTSHEDLASLLAQAVGDGVLRAEQAGFVAINAIDPHDARIVGGTAPFSYASDGVFTLTAASSDNLPNGREQSRSMAREVVSVAPPGLTGIVLATQADFEQAARIGAGSSGWTTYPNLLESGPGLGAAATLEQLEGRLAPRLEVDALGSSLRAALALGAVQPDRASSLRAGRAGPSLDDGRSRASLRPLRSALPDTLHFDEGQAGLTGATPDGWDFAAGPLRLPVETLQPDPTLALDGRPRPFAVSFWFTLDDPLAETILFDAGAGEFEDRIWLGMRAGELVLRVSDTSVADFRGEWTDGQLPPAGEIRYGFDDGLALLPGVPYHVLAFVGGARSSQLALFVDGRARGRRSFTTRLIDDLPSAGGFLQGSASGRGTTRVRVESTAGFPARGALRVGEEIMEYTSLKGDEFVVSAAGTLDPFGGRARRGTFAPEHQASELVELVGYTRPLASVIALPGNGSLNGSLSSFAVAQIDPSVSGAIEINPQVTGGGFLDQAYELGQGLLPGETTIPVVGVDGGNLEDGVFQVGGGYALLFCDYGDDDLVGQVISAESGFGQWVIPSTAIDGSWIGGAEVVQYTSYSSGVLSGVSRGGTGGIPQSIAPGGKSPLEGAAARGWVDGVRTSWADSRSFLTTINDHVSGELGLPTEARVFVIPISVAVNDATDLYKGYHSGLGNTSHLTQIGLDFPEGGAGTEWIRWNTVTAQAFVRDEPDALERMLEVLSASGLNAWDPNAAVDQGVLDTLGVQLRLRGQAGTPSGEHPDGEQVLPVIPFGEWGVDDWEANLGIPGRHDFVTLVDEDGEREWNEVNHATPVDIDWSGYCLVGLRAPIAAEMERSDEGAHGDADRHVVDELDLDAALKPGQAGARLVEELALSDRKALEEAVRRFNVDSRRLTRLVCSPSGELPSLAAAAFHLGEDFDHRPSPGRALIDELRLHLADEPGTLLPPIGRYLLADELAFEEQQVAVLATDQLLLPHARLRGKRLGKDQLEILGELPQAGGLLLIGEEIVAYAGLDPVETGAVFLSGRGLYGTRRALHARTTPVVPLGFWPASPLAAPLGEDDGDIVVVDPSLFPAGGGLLLVEDELLAYDEVLDDALAMPLHPGRSGGGLLRGRFGTQPDSHRAGSMVRWMPARFADLALLGHDVPEAEALRLSLRTPGAFHTELALRLEQPDPLVELVGRVVLDGQGSRHDDPAGDPRVLELRASADDPGLLTVRIGRQAELLELFLSVRWSTGAFDPLGGGSNAWKLVPRVTDVVSEQVQPSLVLEHEEWR